MKTTEPINHDSIQNPGGEVPANPKYAAEIHASDELKRRIADEISRNLEAALVMANRQFRERHVRQLGWSISRLVPWPRSLRMAHIPSGPTNSTTTRP